MQTSSESWGLGQGLATNDIFAKMKNLTFELNSHRYFGSFIQRMLRRRSHGEEEKAGRREQGSEISALLFSHL